MKEWYEDLDALKFPLPMKDIEDGEVCSWSREAIVEHLSKREQGFLKTWRPATKDEVQTLLDNVYQPESGPVAFDYSKPFFVKSMDPEIIKMLTVLTGKEFDPRYLCLGSIGVASGSYGFTHLNNPTVLNQYTELTPETVIHDYENNSYVRGSGSQTVTVKMDEGNVYVREILPKVFVDVYDVLGCFKTECPAIDHAVKKLLVPGGRGVKSSIKDKKEAIKSIQRSIEREETWLTKK